MSAPSSYDRVRALLEWLSPGFPSTSEDADAGKQLSAMATMLGRCTDRVDQFYEELFADGATKNIARWANIYRTADRPGQTIEQRRAAVISVVRRNAGPQLAKLAAMLAPVLDVDSADIAFIEPLRSQIEDAVTIDTGTVSIPLTAGAEFHLYAPFPGLVDAGGLRATIDTSGGDYDDVTIRHVATGVGASTFTGVTSTDRKSFLGKIANSPWKVTFTASPGVTLTRMRLMVSNDFDSASKYFFYAVATPGADADFTEAQRLFTRTAMGQDRAIVATNTGFIAGEGIAGREPIGAP